MNKNIRYYILLLLSLVGVLAGCDNVMETPDPGIFSVYELNGIIDQNAQTKTTLGEQNALTKSYSNLWSANDSIAVYPNGVSDPYQFGLSEGENTTAANFRGWILLNPSTNHFVALYPASFAGSLSGTTLSLTLPSQQKYLADSFGNNTYPMIAVSDSPSLFFKNLCGIIKVSLKGEANVASIKIKANNSSNKLSGPATVSTSFSGAPQLQMGSDGSDQVTLDCEEKVIRSSAATDFYIVVPAQTYTGGITIMITSSQGETTKVISTDVTIQRSMITPVNEIEIESVYTGDQAVLMSLYNATGGPSWTNNTNWGTDADLSTWYGVTTNTDGTVKKLTLSSNNLSGSIPAVIGNLSNLTHLILDNNQLTGFIPSSIGNLSNLTNLDLNNNQLTGTIPEEIANISGLTSFRCQYNYLSYSIHEALKEHPNYSSWELIPQITPYESTDFSYDGTVKQVLTHTVGNGVKLVITGDAFADKDYVTPSTGLSRFDELVSSTVEEFFKEEPYKSFKNRFDIYSVAAVSKNCVIQEGSETIFGCHYGEGTHVSGSDPKVFEYARKAVSSTDIPKTLIMVIINDTKYAGTCYMYTDESAIAYTPFCKNNATDYGSVLRHEAGGHGFSKLMDEYAYTGTIPSNEITQLNTYHTWGWAKNVDHDNNSATIVWAHFLSNSLYTGKVGIYQGAYTYEFGAYRPTENSIMRYNTGGFNAPSRESIYKRIMLLSGDVYTWDKFVEYDAINRVESSGTAPSAITTKAKQYQPLATPVIIEGTWRDASGN